METASKTVIVEALADSLQFNRNPVVALKQIALWNPEIRDLIMRAIADNETTRQIMEELRNIFGDYGPWIADILTSGADPVFIGKVLRDTASIMRVMDELDAERRALLRSRRNLTRFLIVILGVMSAAFSKISELLWYMILRNPYNSSLPFALIGAAFTIFMVEEVRMSLKWLVYYLIPFLLMTFFLGYLFG